MARLLPQLQQQLLAHRVPPSTGGPSVSELSQSPNAPSLAYWGDPTSNNTFYASEGR